MKLHNPVAFRPLPVTSICTFVYLAIVIPLLIVHHEVPQPAVGDAGNLTEAWRDLQTLTNGFHPYNSHRNDQIRTWLLDRIEKYTSNQNGSDRARSFTTVISDIRSNASFSSNGTHSTPGTSVYFEGTNIIVYIKGTQDDSRDWWQTESRPQGLGGVMVNAHYDSVSTGFGATDDGVGVVTILQLIRHFALQQPRRGIIALFNNGEEDYLNGARAFSQHPISVFSHTFLNLEGAGAGGRATLFRSTDTEATRFYQASRSPFGNVVSADAFRRGIVRSETDYSVFTSVLGMRGLDVAFYEPRSRYHTEEDDMKHSSKASLNHMLNAAFATTKGLTSDMSSNFEATTDDGVKYPTGKGSDAVWFDIYGSTFALFKLDSLFAVAVTFLLIGPLSLGGILAGLYRADKLYIFSYSKQSRWSEESGSVTIQGLSGLTRWPLSFVLASAAAVGLAFMLSTINPFIVYSSPYAVWSMMLSAWLVVAYAYVSLADYVRPSALQRAYSLLWIYLVAWIILVLVTIFQRRFRLASGYLFVFNSICVYLATTICLLEQFRLPRKSDYADDHIGPQGQLQDPPENVGNPPPLEPSNTEGTSHDHEQAIEDSQEADESTSLLRGTGRTTFKRYSSPHQRGDDAGPELTSPEESHASPKSYGFEQPWSGSLPSSLWLLQFLLLAVFPLIIFGQVALLLTSATYQTLADGNSPLLTYAAIAILAILLLAPLGPFLHRFTYEIPLFIFLIFIGTLLYNIFAFPFSPSNRLKLFFIQRVDLDSGLNKVSLSGISQGPYLLNTVTSLPSAAGQIPVCNSSSVRKDLAECSWPGLAPQVVDDPSLEYKDWLSFKASHVPLNNSHILLNRPSSLRPRMESDSKASRKQYQAHFSISGRNTRACKIVFSQPIRDFRVWDGGPSDPRFPRVSDKHGSSELRLWSRTWNRTWDVDVWWDEADRGRPDQKTTVTKVPAEGLMSKKKDASKPSDMSFDGRVVCLWSDANEIGVIPALDEVKRFAPAWTTVTKAADGLVEGSKAFSIAL